MANSTISCNTVVPHNYISNKPSYDGAVQNSGILYQTSKKDGYVVSKNFVLKYNSLVDKYGNKFTPPIKHNFGIMPVDQSEDYFIVNQAMVNYLVMNTWLNSGKQ